MESSFYARRRTILFLAFFISGFCGLLYQTVWLRLAFAKFGVITPVVSVIVSVFMLGLGIGSLFGGKLVAYLKARTNKSALFFYAICELVIGCGAFIVPELFQIGSGALKSAGQSDSFAFLFSSALLMSLSILPWCICMGLTIPFIMNFVAEFEKDDSSFSFLYFANVLGAIAGILMTALILVEFFGFKGTLTFAAVCNFLIALIAIAWTGSAKPLNKDERDSLENNASKLEGTTESPKSAFNMLVLFATGFSSMGMEVVWTRAFSNIMGTEVYSFAWLVATYLVSTAMGSFLYRHDLKKAGAKSNALLLGICTISAFLPIVLNDVRFAFYPNVTKDMLEALVLISIAPICVGLGYLTPKLIDDSSKGDPVLAGKAYAVNICGSIIGPLLAGYFLLPHVGSKFSMIILAVPFLGLAAPMLRDLPKKIALVTVVLTLIVATGSVFSKSYEEGGLLIPGVVENVVLRRDHTATVISCNSGPEKLLMINGTHMTVLAQLTKYHAHLPLVMHKSPPKSGLIICFGMGTTFRSVLSWDVDTTAVELVPSVPKAFTSYHANADEVLKNPKGHIVIDDGRRFLNRTQQFFDIVTIDPPPPESRAGSSLLYSADFYDDMKRRLKPDGILHQWLPGNDIVLRNAVIRSLFRGFKYVKSLPSLPWSIHGVEGRGLHLLASNEPIEILTPEQILLRLPPKAKADLVEWLPPGQSEQILLSQLRLMCEGQVDARTLLLPQYNSMITDDRPFNEYYLVRDRLLNHHSSTFH